MSRKDTIIELIDKDPVLMPLVDDMLNLEDQLKYLRKLPMIKVHPHDQTKQKATPAAKLYKEALQQYTNIIRLIMRATGADMEDEESPLRKWFNDHVEY